MLAGEGEKGINLLSNRDTKGLVVQATMNQQDIDTSRLVGAGATNGWIVNAGGVIMEGGNWQGVN